MPEGETQNQVAIERPTVNPPPRSPEKPNPEWLKPQDVDRPVEGTPLVNNTCIYCDMYICIVGRQQKIAP